MSKQIIISAVTYLNTKPFIYGIEHAGLLENYRLELDYPSVCARKLIHDQADIALIPAASLPYVPNASVISDYCIGAEGQVGTVLLLSPVPLQEIESIYLDYQSETSVMLARILAEKLWKIRPEWIPSAPGYEKTTVRNQACIIIGDRAFEYRDAFPFAYDLAEEWKRLTGLPFTFALWVANKKIDPRFLACFNESLRFGIENVSKVIQIINNDRGDHINAEEYFRKKISYAFDTGKKKALELFLRDAEAMNT